jgi:YegS/Rv2252/BmrU family lipid kinase
VKPNTRIILNPEAGGGKAKRILPLLDKYKAGLVKQEVDLVVTRGPGDATRLARESVESGATLVIAAGGDGTINEVVNGMLNPCLMKPSACQLGIIHCGTGGGISQTLGLPGNPAEQLEMLNNTSVRTVDAGYVIFRGHHKVSYTRFFLSELQVGIGGEVVEAVNSAYKKLGGTFAFGLVSVYKLLRCRSVGVKLTVNGTKDGWQKLLGLTIGNGTHCAGGMQLTPQARNDDGLLDLLSIYEMNLAARLWNFSRVYSGHHLRSSKFNIEQAPAFTIESEKPLWIAADGELLGKTPCTVGIIPQAIEIRCSNPHNHENTGN